MKVDIYADIVFINGSVITVNSKNEICEAVAVREDKIIYVGRHSRLHRGKDTDSRFAGHYINAGICGSTFSLYAECDFVE